MDPEIWDTAVVWLARFVIATAAIIICHRGCHAAALVKRHALFGQLFPSNCRDSGFDQQVAQMVDAALFRRFCGLLHIAKFVNAALLLLILATRSECRRFGGALDVTSASSVLVDTQLPQLVLTRLIISVLTSLKTGSPAFLNCFTLGFGGMILLRFVTCPFSYRHVAIVTLITHVQMVVFAVAVPRLRALVCLVFMSVTLGSMWYWRVFFIRGQADSIALPIPVQIIVLNCAFGSMSLIAAAIVQAELWKEARAKLGLQMVLDSTSQGFCTVDVINGIVLSASPQLQETLGGDLTVGQQLSAWAPHDRDKSSLRVLLKAASDAGDLQPTLVTCRTPSSGEPASSFDAKIVPYALSGHELSLCIQIQGEVRHEGARMSFISVQSAPQEEDAATLSSLITSAAGGFGDRHGVSANSVFESSLQYSVSIADESRGGSKPLVDVATQTESRNPLVLPTGGVAKTTNFDENVLAPRFEEVDFQRVEQAASIDLRDSRDVDALSLASLSASCWTQSVVPDALITKASTAAQTAIVPCETVATQAESLSLSSQSAMVERNPNSPGLVEDAGNLRKDDISVRQNASLQDEASHLLRDDVIPHAEYGGAASSEARSLQRSASVAWAVVDTDSQTNAGHRCAVVCSDAAVQAGEQVEAMGRPPRIPSSSGCSRRSLDSRSACSLPASTSEFSACEESHPSSQGEADVASDILRRDFRVTAEQSCQSSLLRLIKHWSTSRTQRTCCPLHGQLRLAKELVRFTMRVPCDPLWSPWTGWQCPNCTCVNCPNTRTCEVCQWVQRFDISVDIDTFETGLPMLSCTSHFEAVFGACQSRRFSDLVEHLQSFLVWFQTQVSYIENGLQSVDSHTLLLRHPSFEQADARSVVAARCRLECRESGMNPNVVNGDDSDIDDAVMILRLLDLSEPMVISSVQYQNVRDLSGHQGHD